MIPRMPMAHCLAVQVIVLSMARYIAAAEDAWDAAPAVHHIRLDLDRLALDSLRERPRAYVHADMRVDGRALPSVRIHLKGASGSFRPMDDKPALTVEIAGETAAHGFPGTSKFHLDNSVEDPSYLCERIGAELFQSAGIPMPRVTHALVSLNGRRLGLYVMKEGFTADFLKRTHAEAELGLFEPEPGQDVDGQMHTHLAHKQSAGKELLLTLAGATRLTNLQSRWSQMTRALDTERFITFMAVEVMIGHRDGYALARNNYRVALDSDERRILFLPHGMDQLFQQPDLPWEPNWSGLVARALMETPAGRIRYKERFAQLLPQILPENELANRIAGEAERLRPFLTAPETAALVTEANALGERIKARAIALRAQLARRETTPLKFADGGAHPGEWVAVDAPAGGKLELVAGSAGRTLRIAAGPLTIASWRTTVRLEPGRYRLSGKVSTANVKSLPFGLHQGATLRITGDRARATSVLGTVSQRLLTTEFAVTAKEEDVQLVCELRASAGEARFDCDSLQLTRLD